MQLITALGQVWHPEHFVCAVCKEEVGTCGFFERDGKPYCEKDYQNLFAPRCGYCKGPIIQVNSILTWLDFSQPHSICYICFLYVAYVSLFNILYLFIKLNSLNPHRTLSATDPTMPKKKHK